SPFATFDNTAGIGVSGPGSTAPAITTLSAVGVNHAFSVNHSGNVEIGSPDADYLPPVFANVPFDTTVEATGTNASVPYTAPTASDLLDGARTVVCTPSSPGSFAIATTTVTCSASDASGNSASASFHVTVRDTQPPVINVPDDITVVAT